jgi:hypothetical protein
MSQPVMRLQPCLQDYRRRHPIARCPTVRPALSRANQHSFGLN